MAKKFTFDDAITTDIKGAASNSYIDNIKMIKIADIETNAENFYSLPDIEDLAEDIDRQGLIHSLAVAKISSEKYKLISGHRRLTAIKLLIENGKWNNETVPCYVITAKKSDAEMNLDLIQVFKKTVWNKLSTEPFPERYTEILVAYTVVCIFCQSTKDIQRTYKLPVIR